MAKKETQEQLKPTCPKCEKEITYLHNVASCVVASEFSLNTRGRGQYLEADYGEVAEDGAYLCPHCSEILAENEQDAITVLKGGTPDG